MRYRVTWLGEGSSATASPLGDFLPLSGLADLGARGTAVVAASLIRAWPYPAHRVAGPAQGGRARELGMQIVVLQPLVALIAGILILIFPRLLNYIVAIYLIVVGLVGLAGQIA
jgi:hypothetical protein